MHFMFLCWKKVLSIVVGNAWSVCGYNIHTEKKLLATIHKTFIQQTTRKYFFFYSHKHTYNIYIHKSYKQLERIYFTITIVAITDLNYLVTFFYHEKMLQVVS